METIQESSICITTSIFTLTINYDKAIPYQFIYESNHFEYARSFDLNELNMV